MRIFGGLLIALLAMGGFGWMLWGLMSSVSKSLEPGNVWSLREETNNGLRWGAWKEDVVIIAREGSWVKIQGVDSGNVWAMYVEAFTGTYRHVHR